MYPDAAQHTPMLQGWESGTGKGPEMSIDLISSFISRIGNFSFLNKNPVFEDRKIPIIWKGKILFSKIGFFLFFQMKRTYVTFSHFHGLVVKVKIY